MSEGVLPMNKKQAVAEARKRWGDKADVRKEGTRHSVGWKFAEIGFSVEGQGATWEEAFEAADERAKHAPEFLERVREALRVLRGDDIPPYEEAMVRDVLRGQADFDKSLQGLVDHIRGVCDYGRQHHDGDKKGLDALEAFADFEGRRLKAFITKFPPVPTFCLICEKPFQEACGDGLPTCSCIGKRKQMEVLLRYAEARTTAQKTFLERLSFKEQSEAEEAK